MLEYEQIMIPLPSLTSQNVWQMLIMPIDHQAPEILAAKVFPNQRFTLVLKKGEKTPPGLKASAEIRTGNYFRGLFPKMFEATSSQTMCMLADLKRVQDFTEFVGREFKPRGWARTISTFLNQFQKGIPGVLGLSGRDSDLSANFLTPHVPL